MDIKRKHLIILTVVVVGILGVSLWALRGDENGSGSANPSPTIQPFGNSAIENDLGFGQALLTPPKSVEVDNQISAPRRVKVYPVLPAPYEYFSIEAAQVIAQKLGFTTAAAATQKSGLYIYREGEKTLVINPKAGTIQFSSASTIQPSSHLAIEIDVNQARTKVKTLLDSLNLDLPIVNWNGAQFNTNGMLVPSLEVAGLPLIPPVDYYARFNTEGELVGLSYWLPNLDYESAEETRIINAEEARKKVKSGDAIVTRGDLNPLAIQPFNHLSLQYLVRPEVIYNLARVQKLQPVYVFENEDVTLYVDAVGE